MKLLLIVLLFATGFQTTCAQNQKDVEEIKKVIHLFQEDFNEGSFKHANQYTTEDWIHINPGGGITTNRDEVLKEVRSIHQTALKGVSMTIINLKVKFISPVAAFANVEHQISSYEMPKGIMHENEHQIKTYLFLKRKGRWLFTLDQNTIVQR